MQRKIHTIDAEDRILGRLAVEIAILLRGKNKPDFTPNKDTGDFVNVKNVGKIKTTGKKMDNKYYYRHSGYLGSLRKTSLGELFKKNPGEVLRRAVLGMLPKNKLSSRQIKRLKIE